MALESKNPHFHIVLTICSRLTPERGLHSPFFLEAAVRRVGALVRKAEDVALPVWGQAPGQAGQQVCTQVFSHRLIIHLFLLRPERSVLGCVGLKSNAFPPPPHPVKRLRVNSGSAYKGAVYPPCHLPLLSFPREVGGLWRTAYCQSSDRGMTAITSQPT